MNTRRNFVQAIAFSGLAAARGAAADPGAKLVIPTVMLGKHTVSRLIAGYNPVGGYSHSVPKLSVIMRNWFTLERTVEFIEHCEQQGINTWQASIDTKVYAALRQAWERGSRMQWICLMHDAEPAQWKEIVDLKPIAVVHHGEFTDRMYRDGSQGKIADFLKKAHDFGVMAGISSHNPNNIARSEDAGWEQDLYMTCFYNIRRDIEKVRSGMGDIPVDELYLSQDPARMTDVVRQVKRPCLAFKILAAGRLCNNRSSIEKAFAYAYRRIKPSDAAIVGMFPMLADEIAEDAAIARAVLQS
jgi:hypothetical protein